MAASVYSTRKVGLSDVGHTGTISGLAQLGKPVERVDGSIRRSIAPARFSSADYSR
jgi:hypothetical protein